MEAYTNINGYKKIHEKNKVRKLVKKYPFLSLFRILKTHSFPYIRFEDVEKTVKQLIDNNPKFLTSILQDNDDLQTIVTCPLCGSDLIERVDTKNNHKILKCIKCNYRFYKNRGG